MKLSGSGRRDAEPVVWLGIRRDQPDWMVMWGWGAMNPTAVKEATKINFPMDKFIGIWWSGGEATTGGRRRRPRAISRSTSTASAPIPGDPGHHQARGRQGQEPGPGQGRRETYYNRGVYNSVLIAEAIRNAQRITGKKVVTGEDVRRGLEALNITAARWKELGCESSPADHQRVVRRPQRPPRPTCSNGTVPSGSRSPTGSRR